MIKVGLDYHTERSYLSVLNDANEKIHEGVIETVGLPAFMEDLGQAKVLFEAGYGWPRLVKLLAQSGVDVNMCHAADSPMIGGSPTSATLPTWRCT